MSKYFVPIPLKILLQFSSDKKLRSVLISQKIKTLKLMFTLNSFKLNFPLLNKFMGGQSGCPVPTSNK